MLYENFDKETISKLDNIAKYATQMMHDEMSRTNIIPMRLTGPAIEYMTTIMLEIKETSKIRIQQTFGKK